MASSVSILNRMMLVTTLLTAADSFMLGKVGTLSIYSLIEIVTLSLKLVADISYFSYNISQTKRKTLDPKHQKSLSVGHLIFIPSMMMVVCSILNELEKNDVFEILKEVSLFKVLAIPLTICVIALYFHLEERGQEETGIDDKTIDKLAELISDKVIEKLQPGTEICEATEHQIFIQVHAHNIP